MWKKKLKWRKRDSSRPQYRLWWIKNNRTMWKIFNYFSSMITSDARCTREIKSRTAMVEQLSTVECYFHQQIGLKFKEETRKVLHLEHSFVWCWNLAALESRSEMPGKFWSVVLEKYGEDRSDSSCEKWRSSVQDDYNLLRIHTISRREANLTGHMLRINCLLKRVIGRKIEGRIKVTWRRERRRKQLLGDFK